jgi:hypothetical protein
MRPTPRTSTTRTASDRSASTHLTTIHDDATHGFRPVFVNYWIILYILINRLAENFCLVLKKTTPHPVVVRAARRHPGPICMDGVSALSPPDSVRSTTVQAAWIDPRGSWWRLMRGRSHGMPSTVETCARVTSYMGVHAERVILAPELTRAFHFKHLKNKFLKFKKF